MLISVTLDGFRKRKDKSYSITFITSTEGSKALHNELFDLQDACGMLYFKGADISAQEVEQLDSTELDLYDKPKTKSQRLRGVLFKVWESKGKEGKFDEFYKAEMERIIEHFKGKIEL